VSQDKQGSLPSNSTRLSSLINEWLPAMTWGVAGALIVFLILLLIVDPGNLASASPEKQAVEISSAPTLAANSLNAELPPLIPEKEIESVKRSANPITVITSQQRKDIVSYLVETKDSLFGIAGKFKIKPETILWANYDVLNDEPDMLSPGQELNIPPVDGVLHTWEEGDTLESVADTFEVEIEEILLWSPNRLDLTNPVVEVGTEIMIPGGEREFRQWLMPTIPRGAAGVLTSVLGGGVCDTSQGGAFGTGAFMCPNGDCRFFGGNDYSAAHLAVDFAVGVGDPIYAADSGLVVFSGWSGGGYGNTIVIDHGNGYQTLYAHNSSVVARCGQSVNKGNIVAYGGSTGNSTGAHLHFEVRFNGGFVNPWYVLP
jgi:murein DD-endopeptidase MepM/ murein hydrolase activator NlpD